MRAFLKEVEAELGPISTVERISLWLTLPLCLWTWLKARLSIGQQPKLIRIEYRL
jgi:hypothetical protein